MSNMKCPFCLQEMHKNQDNLFYCGTDYCELKHIEMPKKALEHFAESYQNRLNDCKRIGDLNEELILTRKALDIAVDALKNVTEYLSNQEPLVDVMAMNLYTDLSKALEQITALEQKDVK